MSRLTFRLTCAAVIAVIALVTASAWGQWTHHTARFARTQLWNAEVSLPVTYSGDRGTGPVFATTSLASPAPRGGSPSAQRPVAPPPFDWDSPLGPGQFSPTGRPMLLHPAEAQLGPQEAQPPPGPQGIQPNDDPGFLGAPEESPEGALRRHYLELQRRKAELMTEEQLREALHGEETAVRELQAARRLDEARQLLESVTADFPDTEAARRAEQMLSAPATEQAWSTEPLR